MQNKGLRVIPPERWQSKGTDTWTPTNCYLRAVGSGGKQLSTALKNTVRQKDMDAGSWKPHKWAGGSGDVSRKQTSSLRYLLFIAVGSTWQRVSSHVCVRKWMIKCDSTNGNEVLTPDFIQGTRQVMHISEAKVHTRAWSGTATNCTPPWAASTGKLCNVFKCLKRVSLLHNCNNSNHCNNSFYLITHWSQWQ